MAALSDYLESGLLHHVFRGETFPKPYNVSVALCSGVPVDANTGEDLPELPSGYDKGDTGYRRLSLGKPSSIGNAKWTYSNDDHAVGSGVIKNTASLIFDEGDGSAALIDWGWVSGIAICDDAVVGSGNVLMHAQLTNPRIIYQGDTVKFDVETLQVRFK